MEQKMTLEEKDIAALAVFFDGLAKSATSTRADVEKVFREKWAEKLEDQELAGKQKKFIIERTKSATTREMKGLGSLEGFTGWPLGPSGREKDWNEKRRDEVQADAKTGGKKRVMEMAENGDILAVVTVVDGPEGKLKNEYKPITKLLKKMIRIRKGDKTTWKMPLWLDKEHTKPAYELWQSGDPVVPVDQEEFLSDGETENWNKGNVLGKNFGYTFTSLVFKSSDKEHLTPRLLTIKVYGELADPENEKFIGSKIPFGKPCVIKCVLDQKKSTPEMLQGKITKHYVIEPIEDDKTSLVDKLSEDWRGYIEYTGDPFDGKFSYEKAMVQVLDKEKKEFVDKSLTAIKKEKEWQKKYSIVRYPFSDVTIATMREWHEKYQTTDDEFNKIIRKWHDDKEDKEVEAEGKNYARICVLECTMSATDEPEEGNNMRVTVQDNSDPDVLMSVFMPNHITSLPFPSADVFLIGSTSKGKDAYNPESGEREDMGKEKNEIKFNPLCYVTIYVHKDTPKPAKAKEPEKSEPEEPEV